MGGVGPTHRRPLQRSPALIRRGDKSACKPDSVPHQRGRPSISGAAVADGLMRPTRRLGAGHPSAQAIREAEGPLGLAPGGVCLATAVTCGAGGLLHHRFTLTSAEAVCFLWHFPAGHPGWALPTTLPCGVRTFLDHLRKDGRGRPADLSGDETTRLPREEGVVPLRSRQRRGTTRLALAGGTPAAPSGASA